MQKEKEICAKAESFDSIKQTITTYEAKIEELENQIQIFMIEKNDLETKVEETLQDSGRGDLAHCLYLRGDRCLISSCRM